MDPYNNNQQGAPYGQPQNRQRQPRYPEDIQSGETRKPETFAEKLHGWRLGISIEAEPIIRGLTCLLLITLFALLQTTLFTRFRPFGAVPDLMLPLVVSISISLREKWGAVSGLLAAFIIESLGGSPVTILALLYMPAGYICGLLNIYYFRDGLAVRAMYTLATTAARCFFTLLIITMSMPSVSIPSAFVNAVFPEFFATVLFAFLPHLTAKYVIRLVEGKMNGTT